MIKIYLLFLLCYLTCSVEEPYKLVIHNTDPEAKCVDGSSPALYVHEGGDTKHIMVFFVGGGFCTGITTQMVLEDCYKRAQTDLGSSKFYTPELISPGGYLSTDPTLSRFANWTKVIVTYCDGAQHQGYTKDPISYKDTKLYLRGAFNTRSHFKWLQNTYKISQADKVLLTGASAGGIATFTWSNYLRSMMKKPQNLYTIADSSIFADIARPFTDIHFLSIVISNLFKVSNIDQKFPIEECNKKFPGKQWKCFLIENSVDHLDSKIMFLNSEYDPIGISDTMDITCMKRGKSGYSLSNCTTNQMAFIEYYRGQYLKIVDIVVEKGHSIWTIACCQHSYACYGDYYNSSAQKIPQLSGSTVAEAIERFVFDNEKVVLIDEGPWPKNEPCAF